MDRFLAFITCWLISIVLFVSGCFYYLEYKHVKKHYKDMTFMEYVFTKDKLIITPERVHVR